MRHPEHAVTGSRFPISSSVVSHRTCYYKEQGRDALVNVKESAIVILTAQVGIVQA